ncbi:oxidoreductase [Luteibacter aegosomatis]|uniref:oxidoreductase n=1 Tax=Luteibacter aegosomatis TaxID=2911537 RepID=UPI001FF9A525|nr:oxidoreductase [Luteibacter aegosomatis]UPG87644.1 oxidoreductase [Luteibacter aegosomatis]
MAKWTTADIPPQQGRTAVVTGPGGLGFEDALALARAGAHVILAGRNPTRGAAAVARISETVPGANVTYEVLDLASLASIESFAARLRDSLGSLDLLINNAAVMSPPTRLTTVDGFESQLGTNYLGHFALTGRLLPLLRKGDAARVVSLSSVAARSGAIRFDDLQSERGYAPMSAYAQSKLACLMFALELQRRADAAGWGIRSMGAHPGISRTDLIPNGFGPRSAAGVVRRLFWFLFQPAAQGALPTLFAATSHEARGGAYYGPDRLSEVRGFPAVAKVPSQALDRQAADRLWSESERLTGMVYA